MLEESAHLNGLTATQRLFLLAYENEGSLRKAAKKINISRSSHNAWLGTDKRYADAFVVSQVIKVENLEDQLNEIASGQKPSRASVTALIFALKAEKPEKYKERWAGDITHKGGITIHQAAEIVEQKRAEIAALDAAEE